jgi:hypothetical protein
MDRSTSTPNYRRPQLPGGQGVARSIPMSRHNKTSFASSVQSPVTALSRCDKPCAASSTSLCRRSETRRRMRSAVRCTRRSSPRMKATLVSSAVLMVRPRCQAAYSAHECFSRAEDRLPRHGPWSQEGQAKDAVASTGADRTRAKYCSPVPCIHRQATDPDHLTSRRTSCDRFALS